MPLPWKKNKVTRISQIVADLQSPKHGGSLVVETGFPTSLIDLFVKNRSRFKKRKSKKRLPLDISDPLPPPAPPPSPPSPWNSATSLEVSAEPGRLVNETVREDNGDANLGRILSRVSECDGGYDPIPSGMPWNSTNGLEVSAEPRYSEATSLSRLARETVHDEDDGVVNSGRVRDLAGECAGGIEANMVLAGILKMLAVVVLILSVKKITVGITVSAFVLLLFEYVGKHMVRRLNLKTYWNANEAFRSLAQRVSCSFWLQKIALKRMKNCEASEQQATVHEEAVELCSASSTSSIEEIKIVQANSETDIQIEVNSVNRDNRRVCPEMDDDSKRKVAEHCKISECTTKGKRSAKFKSKMMKIFVPKKQRALRKEKKEKKRKEREAESSSEVSSTITMEGDKSARFEIEEQEMGKIAAPVIQSELECIKDEEDDNGTTCSNEEGRRDSAGSSGYLILILIALAGLVGGRTPALLFTVGWCVILKMVKTRGRTLNLSLIKLSLYQSLGKRLSGVW